MTSPKQTKAFVSEMSLDKSSLPGGDSKPSEMSASKKLSSVGASSLRSQSFTPETVFGKI